MHLRIQLIPYLSSRVKAAPPKINPTKRRNQYRNPVKFISTTTSSFVAGVSVLLSLACPYSTRCQGVLARFYQYFVGNGYLLHRAPKRENAQTVDLYILVYAFSYSETINCKTRLYSVKYTQVTNPETFFASVPRFQPREAKEQQPADPDEQNEASAPAPLLTEHQIQPGEKYLLARHLKRSQKHAHHHSLDPTSFPSTLAIS